MRAIVGLFLIGATWTLAGCGLFPGQLGDGLPGSTGPLSGEDTNWRGPGGALTCLPLKPELEGEPFKAAYSANFINNTLSEPVTLTRIRTGEHGSPDIEILGAYGQWITPEHQEHGYVVLSFWEAWPPTEMHGDFDPELVELTLPVQIQPGEVLNAVAGFATPDLVAGQDVTIPYLLYDYTYQGREYTLVDPMEVRLAWDKNDC